MATVPRYTDVVQQRPLQLPDARPEGYGGGDLARGLGQAADAVAKMQDEEDQLFADAADIELAGTASNLLREYQQSKGEDAIRRSGEVFTQFEEEAQRVMSAMAPRVRERFANRYARQQIALREQVLSHSDKEAKSYFDSTNKATFERIGNDLATAARTGGDTSALMIEARERIGYIRQHSMSPWASPEEADAAERKVMSSLVRQQLEAQYAAKLPDAAALTMAEVGDLLTEEDRAAITTSARGATIQAQVDAAFTKAMTITDPAERLKFVNSLRTASGDIDTQVQTQVWNLVKQQVDRVSEMEAGRKAELIREFDQWSATNPGVSPEEYFMSRGRMADATFLGDAVLDQLRQRARSFDDQRAWSDFFSKYSRDPRALSELPPDQFALIATKLSATRDNAERMYAAAIAQFNPNATAGQRAAGQGVFTSLQRMEATAQRYGIMASEATIAGGRDENVRRTTRAASQDRLVQFQRAVDAAIMQETAALGVTKLTDEQEQQVMNRVAWSQIRMDANQNARTTQSSTRIAADMSDPLLYPSGGAYDKPENRLTPEQRLQLYVPIEIAEQAFTSQGNLLARARKLLADRSISNPSEYMVMRIAAQLMYTNESDTEVLDIIDRIIKGER